MRIIIELAKNAIEKIKSRFIKDYEIKKLREKGAKIGENFWMSGCIIDAGFTFLVEIGDNVTLFRTTILTHDASTQHICNKTRVGKVKIGNNVFVGANSIILPNVHIGSNVIIGAGSVVNRDIPDNSVAVGNPCRVIESYDEYAEKTRKNLQTHPVYDVHYSKKTQEQIRQEQIDLDETWGYDV